MKKYVLVGAGSRALYMFAKPMHTDWKDNVDFCGVFDTNLTRATLLSETCGKIPVYNDFNKMLEEAKPDVVIVASSDDTHHHYIIAALHAGCDVITEKPMTINESYCREILTAEKQSGKKVQVTFNLRFAPYFARVKELLSEGAIGDVYHLQMEWFLDRDHGADYFRRWHSEMKRSGGLLVHKSTHHFDIINWWLDSRPINVQAFGSRRVYGAQQTPRGERCLTCKYKASCEFYKDVTTDPFLMNYYIQAEEDGYWRDRCVFDERIDIYDTMNVNVSYENGTLFNYSLIAYAPYEGWKATINGSKGRLEIGNVYRSANLDEVGESEIRLIHTNGASEIIDVAGGIGSHGGGDAKLLKSLFEETTVEDPLGQQAGSMAGATSLLIGATANRSIQEGKVLPVPTIDQLLV